MHRFSRHVASFLSLLVLVACGGESAPATAESPAGAGSPAPAVASSSDREADALELEDYTLTMEELQRWGRAAEALARIGRANPALQDSVIIDSGDLAIDPFADRLERTPGASDAVEAAGFSPREYAVATYVVVQSVTALDAIRQGMTIEQIAEQASVNPENVRFAQRHEAEMHAMIARAGG